MATETEKKVVVDDSDEVVEEVKKGPMTEFLANSPKAPVIDDVVEGPVVALGRARAGAASFLARRTSWGGTLGHRGIPSGMYASGTTTIPHSHGPLPLVRLDPGDCCIQGDRRHRPRVRNGTLGSCSINP